MDVYYTQNSVYEIDLDAMRYRRSPAGEENVPSEKLTYGEWHPLACAPVVVPDPFQPFRAPENRDLVLHIMHETSTLGIFTSKLVGMN